MASPEGSPGAVEVRADVVNGRVSPRDPKALVAEIERTREQLAQTIDTLAERVSPGANIRRLRDQLSERAAQPEVQLAAVAVGLAVAGIAIYRIWGRRKRS